MPPLIPYRVRIWQETELAAAPGADALTAATEATFGDPSHLVTAEAEEGAGKIIAVAVGTGGDTAFLWTPPGPPVDYKPTELALRSWAVEGNYEEMGAPDLPESLLAEFHEALYEDGVRGVRLLTAERSDAEGRPMICAVSWYDSLEYELRLSDDDEIG